MQSLKDAQRELKEGQLIITERTFKKRVEWGDRSEGPSTCWYKGREYYHQWFLTYGHDQYETLTPVA